MKGNPINVFREFCYAFFSVEGLIAERQNFSNSWKLIIVIWKLAYISIDYGDFYVEVNVGYNWCIF